MDAAENHPGGEDLCRNPDQSLQNHNLTGLICPGMGGSASSDIPPPLFQLPEGHTNSCDNISQFSVDSITSLESKEPIFIAAGDIRSEPLPLFWSRTGGFGSAQI